MKIVYIGPKAQKIDMTTGSQQVFRRFEPLDIEKEYALRLLRFPTVYVEEKDLEAFKLRAAAAERSKEEQEAATAALIQQEEEDANRVINIAGTEVDLRKYTQIKLETLVESEDLVLEPKSSSERVPEYCDRVFAAFQDKKKGE